MGISLDKRAEKVGIVLAKRGITTVPAVRVGCALDVSGSAQGFYRNGVMQETVERLMGVAMKFDDNGELDMWAFSDTHKRVSTATVADAATFIDKKFLKEAGSTLWCGTSYAPVLQDVISYYFPTGAAAATQAAKGFLGGLFGKKEAAPAAAASTNDTPAMLLFVTDGSNDDRAAAARVMKEAQGKPIYFMMVGIGNPSMFTFIQEQADLLPNVGFVSLNDLNISDDDLYEQLVSGEFATWVKQYVK